MVAEGEREDEGGKSGIGVRNLTKVLGLVS